MFERGLIAWSADSHSLGIARGLLFASLLLLPFMAIAAPGGVIAADLCLMAGWGAGLLSLRSRGQRLQVPVWGWWIAGVLLPYMVVMLLGTGRQQLPGYALSLVQHLYAPCFGVLLAYGIQVFWPDRAVATLYRGIALAGLIVVVMDLLIFALAITGVYVFTPAFRDGIYTSRLDWPFAQPSQLPGFLLVTFPITAFWLFEIMAARWRIELAVFVTLLNIVAHATIAAMSGSRAGAVAVILEGLGVVLLVFLRTPRRKWSLLLILLLASSTAAASGLLWLSETNWVVRRSLLVLSDARSGVNVVSTDFRAHNWEFARRLFLESPVLGAGLSASVAQYGYEVHNTFLSAFAELGIIGGTTAATLLVGVPLYTLWRVLSRRRMLSGPLPVLPLLLAFGGTVFLGVLHYVLRQRWVWLAIAFLFLLLAELRRENDEAI